MKHIIRTKSISYLLLFNLIFICLLTTCKDPEIFKPIITKLVPEHESPGFPVQIVGELLEFGTWVNIGGERLLFSLNSKDTALAIIPEEFNLKPGNYDLYIETVKNKSNSLPFTLLPKSISFITDLTVNALEPWKIKLNHIGETQVVLCHESKNFLTINIPSVNPDSTIIIDIPRSLWYDNDTVSCTVEVRSEQNVKSDLKKVTFFNTKNPKFTKSTYANKLGGDTLNLQGENFINDSLRISIDNNPVDIITIVDSKNIWFILPDNIYQVGKILLKTKYGEEEATYSKGNEADRIPEIDVGLTRNKVYSDDQIIIKGVNFKNYGIAVLMKLPNQSMIELDRNKYLVKNDSSINIDFPVGINEVTILLKNSYGSSDPISISVLAPPIIQTILPKSNPVQGPMYIYGKNLLSTSAIVFIKDNVETEISNIQVYSRCFDINKDTCDIVTLNIPPLATGDYQIYISIKEGSKEIKRSKNPSPFKLIQNYDPNTFAGIGNTNVILPVPPVAPSINDVGNGWVISNNSTIYQINQPPDFNTNSTVYPIENDKGEPIGSYRRNGTFIDILIKGIQYYGQFDDQYYDDNPFFYVRKMVLIPEEQGNVLVLFDRTSTIDSLSKYQFISGEQITIYGYFMEDSYDFVYEDESFSESRMEVTKESTETILKFNLPTTILEGEYTIYLQDFFGDQTISNRKIITISP